MSCDACRGSGKTCGCNTECCEKCCGCCKRASEYHWRWEIRRSSYVLLNPSGSEQVKVSRKHPLVGVALKEHEAKWGTSSLEAPRQVTGGEARDLMDALGPLTKSGRAW